MKAHCYVQDVILNKCCMSVMVASGWGKGQRCLGNFPSSSQSLDGNDKPVTPDGKQLPQQFS